MKRKRRKKKSVTAQENKTSGTFFPGVQTKLAIGKADDPYEKEADAVADKVVSNSGSENAIQKMETPIAEGVQKVQKLETEEEPVQKMEEEESVQKMEEEEPVQKMEEEEPVQKMKEEEPVQKMEEEEPIQKMEEEEPVQKMEEEEPVQKMEEEEVQTKSNNEKAAASPNIESKLKSSSGKGNKMDPDTKAEMEAGFGADFSNVNVHSDSSAVEMSEQLGAQAFTHGNDIYFNEGKFDPQTQGGKHLLAHELTHTIQQKGMVQRKIQKKDLISPRFKGNSTLESILDGAMIVSTTQNSNGSHVRIIQQSLEDAGFKLKTYGVDGDYGGETKGQVEAFQKARKLVVSEQDGIVGKNTMEEFDKQYVGNKTEHDEFAGISEADLNARTRTITPDEKKALEEAMNTESAVNPKKKFKVPLKHLYKAELKKETERILISQYNRLGKGKQRKRRKKSNLHDTNDIDALAKVSKREADAVFGNVKQGKALKFGVNIFDRWKSKKDSLKGLSRKDKKAEKKEWADWRVQKIIESKRMEVINGKYNAIQSRPDEALIVTSIINELSKTYRKKLVKTHLGWPGSASGGKIFLQRLKSKDNDKNRAYMWDNFGTIIHEYLHTLEDSKAIAYRKTLDEKKGGKVLREGIPDYFTKIVWKNLDLTNHVLRAEVEGASFYDSTKNDIPPMGYYPEAKNAENMAGIVGTANIMAYFFLGKVHLIDG